MANGNGTLNHAETIQALTEFNNPPNGNGQNTIVTPSRHDISKARTLENKALAIQNQQQIDLLDFRICLWVNHPVALCLGPLIQFCLKG